MRRLQAVVRNALRRHRPGRAVLGAARRGRAFAQANAASMARRRARQAGRGRLMLSTLRGRAARTRRRQALDDLRSSSPPPGAIDGRDIVTCLAPTTTPLDPHWQARLGHALGGNVVAATVLTLDRTLAIRAAGLELVVDAQGVPVARARHAHEPVTSVPARARVDGATGACLVVDRDAFMRAGGMRSLGDADVEMFDLCWRLQQDGGRIVAVRDAVVQDNRPTPLEAGDALDSTGPAWSRVVDDYGAALYRRAVGATTPPRIAITVAAPSARVAARWGDWHLARALASALERRGCETRVQTADHADDLAGRACDVHLVIRGLQTVRRTAGQKHVLWVISHPEAVTVEECDDADLVLVASTRFAEELRARTDTPVEVMLQATDHHRFHPMAPEPRFAHPIVVVAKSRDVMRGAVAAALAAGIRPAIYGSGWDGLVDRNLVVGDYVSNEDLPVVYSSAGVLLNDHWDTMRSFGFVSNRLYDALACGTPVISDHMPEIGELFGDAVATFTTPDELRARLEELESDPAGARARADAGRRLVLREHTFDERARSLLSSFERYGVAARTREWCTTKNTSDKW
jgi:glycosyltransferase involved in cell wall biosynthesis